MSEKYYNPSKLLSLKDLEGKTPEIFICTTNRSAGKTTAFTKLLIDNFIENGKKFIVLYRFKNELKGCSNKIFSSVKELFYPDYSMYEKSEGDGAFVRLFLEKNNASEHCGYACAINTADKLKRYSNELSDACVMFYDEFMSETNIYAPREVEKFISLHTSIARGGGSQCKYLPVYLCGNCVTLLNPYYCALGVFERLRKDTKYLRGKGWVLEQGFNEYAAEASRNSAFNIAFSGSDYIAYSTENIYLRDSEKLIGKPPGKSRYVCSIISNKGNFSIREYDGVMYVCSSCDMNYPIRYTLESESLAGGERLLSDSFINIMRNYFRHGKFIFENQTCKNIIFKFLSY